MNSIVVTGILLIQAVFTIFFVSDILLSVFGIYVQPISWQVREYLEIGAALGLILGVVLGGIALRTTMRARARAEEKLRRASGEFMALLDERFAEWGLTPAEQDVALFAIKGLSLQDIATLRATSEGTVKAQTNAIYRKAGVNGRPQLLSLFIEDLMDADHPRPADAARATASPSPATQPPATPSQATQPPASRSPASAQTSAAAAPVAGPRTGRAG